MDLIIDKRYYNSISTSYGSFVDDEGNTYPFEYRETRKKGNRVKSLIKWKKIIPKDKIDVEELIMDVFSNMEE